MRSRYLTALVFAVALSLVFVSCDSFFSTNLFKSAGLGQVSPDKLKGETSAELVDDAYNDNGDPSTSFFDALSGDTTVRDEVLATLAATYTSPSASPTAVQEAASLAAQIEIVTTGADELVNNVVEALGDIQSLSGSDPQGAVDLLESLVPAGLAASEASFSAAIEALISANDIYLVLGASVAANDVQGDINIGTAAQSAMLAAALDGIDATGLIDPDTGSPYTSTAAYLWDSLQGKTIVGTPTFTPPDTSAGSPLGSLIEASGLTI
jgi:hypothetical protein